MAGHHQVHVGAVGWTHADWRGPFYPEDLPEDWMLSYYNTQFQAVYLPASVWRAASPEHWQQWLFDSRDEFVFVLEATVDMVAPSASDRIVLASPQWEDDNVCWIDDAPDLRALAGRITEQALAGRALYVFSRRGDLALLERVSTLKQVMGY